MRKTLAYHQLKKDALVVSFSGAINWYPSTECFQQKASLCLMTNVFRLFFTLPLP